jgi:hypothetical protein
MFDRTQLAEEMKKLHTSKVRVPCCYRVLLAMMHLFKSSPINNVEKMVIITSSNKVFCILLLYTPTISVSQFYFIVGSFCSVLLDKCVNVTALFMH